MHTYHKKWMKKNVYESQKNTIYTVVDDKNIIGLVVNFFKSKKSFFKVLCLQSKSDENCLT